MKTRYPGIVSFTTAEADRFFGRDREIKELFRLIVLNQTTVLFGKSGTGKTSLLQAGVAPLLGERGIRPVKLRLNKPDQPIAQQLFEQFDEGEYLPIGTPDTLSLWEYCHRFEYVEGGEAHTPLLVFDQFEELFTLYGAHPAQQQTFIGQLADLLNARPPVDLPAEVDPAPPLLRVVISIRSDFLYLLDRLSAQVPAILRCRYELTALDEANARRAITAPTDLAGDFDTPPFAYSPAALEAIISSLTPKSDPANREVEAFQLQLLCQRIEQMLLARNVEKISDLCIEPAFFGGEAGLQAIRSDFYQSILAKITSTDQRLAAQQLVEEDLLSEGRRIPLEREFLKRRRPELDNNCLDLLSTERLLVKESRGGLFFFEISHDTLTEPILKVLAARRAAEEKVAAQRTAVEAAERARMLEAQATAERKRAEEAERLQTAAEKGRKNARIAALLAAGVALVAIGLGVFAVKKQGEAVANERKANEQTQLANERKLAAETALRKIIAAKKEKLQQQIKLDETAEFLKSVQKNKAILILVDSLEKAQTAPDIILSQLEK